MTSIMEYMKNKREAETEHNMIRYASRYRDAVKLTIGNVERDLNKSRWYQATNIYAGRPVVTRRR